MTRVNDSPRIPARGRPGGGGVGGHHPETGSLGTDGLHINRDGVAAAEWFWKAIQHLRLALATIEAKFGLLPPPAPLAPQSPLRDGPPPTQVETPKVVDGFRNVVATPPKAAETATHITLSGVRLQIANRRLEEEAAVSKLSAADKAGYSQVASLVETDAEGRLALQNLVMSGKLNGAKASDGKSAWVQLGILATGKLGADINRLKLVAHLLEELDDPTKIYQGDHNTCVPAAVSIMMARRQPAELVRLIGGLAGPDGFVNLANGDTIKRAIDWRSPDGGRTIDQALLQPALISYGVQAEGLTYDNARDRLSDGGNGLSVDEANVVYEGVTKRNSTVVSF